MSKAQIIQFKPKREVGAIENVNAFIEKTKGWNIFGNHVDWDDSRWDMSEHTEYRAKAAAGIKWTNLDTTTGRGRKAPLLQQPLLDFAKAYITYTQGLNPTKTYLNTLYAIRALERALCNRYSKPCVTKIDANDLNATQKILYDRDKTKHKRQVATLCAELERLNLFLDENHMRKGAPFIWKHSVSFTYPDQIIGDDFKAYRADKLPTDTCIYALADIYRSTDVPKYKLASAIALLLFSNPCRIGEVLTLDHECLIRDFQNDPEAIALRWFPEKGADPFLKPILPSWRDLVIEAIFEIKRLTSEGRKIARWYENNPDKAYLSKKYEHLRKERVVTSTDLKNLLPVPVVATSLSRTNVSKLGKREGYEWFYSFHDIEQLVLSRLPDGMPFRLQEQKLRFSESLFVVPCNFFHPSSTAFSKVLFEPVKYSHLKTLYGGGSGTSMFDKLGMFEPDGSKIVFNPHSARHFIETTSEYGQIDQDIRALYAGRKSASQNSWYSHGDKNITSLNVLEVRDQSDVIPSNAKTGIDVYSQPQILSDLVKKEFNPTNDSFNEIKADVTNAGFCLLGMDQTCKKIQDHFLCSDHLYIKGDPRLEVIIPYEIEKLESDNKQWLKTINGDKNPTVVRNRQVLQVLNNIMGILADSQIPKGSFFRLAHGKDYSKSRVAYYQKNKKLLGSVSDGAIPLIKIGELCLST